MQVLSLADGVPVSDVAVTFHHDGLQWRSGAVEAQDGYIIDFGGVTLAPE